MDPTIDTCAYPTSDIISEMGRLPLKSRKITCRLTFGAGQRLDAALATLAHDKLGRPPTGALLSRLILDLSDPEWARIVRSLPQKPGILLKEVQDAERFGVAEMVDVPAAGAPITTAASDITTDVRIPNTGAPTSFSHNYLIC